MPNFKRIGGGPWKNGKKSDDLTWNDPYAVLVTLQVLVTREREKEEGKTHHFKVNLLLEREKEKGAGKEKVGRRHQRVDRSRLQQQSESSRGPSEMAEDCRRYQQSYDHDGSGHR